MSWDNPSKQSEPSWSHRPNTEPKPATDAEIEEDHPVMRTPVGQSLKARIEQEREMSRELGVFLRCLVAFHVANGEWCFVCRHDLPGHFGGCAIPEAEALLARAVKMEAEYGK